MNEEVKKLEKCRDGLDSAINKARRSSGANIDTTRNEAEKVYNLQLELVREQLYSFFNNQVIFL